MLELSEAATRRDSHQADVPVIIKYMGSKKPILDFITSNIRRIHIEGNIICDLFAGSCSVSAALRKDYSFISNDIQDYSRIIGQTYFSDFSEVNSTELIETILELANKHNKRLIESLGYYIFDYNIVTDLKEFYRIEELQRKLFETELAVDNYNLFTKFYSGTYWSCEQCTWIDSLRKAAEEFKDTAYYNVILSSIMFAMANTSQSTGHFAQYRDGHSEDSMQNILIYRQKDFLEPFRKKLAELIRILTEPVREITATTQDFVDCLKSIPANTTVYADPPYAPVHYSRFYHALETLVKYDYPNLEFKGRYRTDRHQSPFSQKTKALEAFGNLFDGIVEKQSQMLLSYSNSGVVEIEQIIELAQQKFTAEYVVEVQTFDHIHSTMEKLTMQEGM